MPEIDYNNLEERLTNAFVEYQWRLDAPFPLTNESREVKEAHYYTNAVFRAKITALVAGVLDIVHRSETTRS